MLEKIEKSIGCLMLLFKSSQKERRFVCSLFSLHWILELIQFISICSDLMNFWGYITQILLLLGILCDLTMLAMYWMPEIFKYFRVTKDEMQFSIIKIEETLITYIVYKQAIVDPILVMQIKTVDQLLIIFVSIMSALNITLARRAVNGNADFTTIIKERIKLIMPLFISVILIIIYCTSLSSKYFLNTPQPKVVYLAIISMFLACILTNRGWIHITRNIQRTIEESVKNIWSHWDNFHLPVLVIKQNFEINYSNKAAKAFFAPLSKDKIKLFANQLIDAELTLTGDTNKNNTLSAHLNYLFTLLEGNLLDTDNSNQKHISSVKEYVMGQDTLLNPFRPLLTRKAGDTRFQVEIFEVEKLSQTQDCLLLVINENVSAKDYREVKAAKQKNEIITVHMLNSLANHVSNLIEDLNKSEENIQSYNKGSFGEIKPTSNTDSIISSIKRLNATINSWQEIVRIQEGAFLSANEVNPDEFCRELHNIFDQAAKSKYANFICSYSGKQNSWCINYRKLKGLVVNLLNIGMLHLEQHDTSSAKELRLLMESDNKKISLFVSYPAAPILETVLEQERLLFFAFQELANKLNATFTRPSFETEEKYSKDHTTCIQVEINIGSLNTNRGIAANTGSQEFASLAELGEHEESKISESKIDQMNRKPLLASTSKGSIKSSKRENQKRVPSKLIGETSFGCIPLISASKSDIFSDIPDEFPEGSEKIKIENAMISKLHCNIFERNYSLRAGIIKTVMGIIVSNNERIGTILNGLMLNEGIKEILWLKNYNEDTTVLKIPSSMHIVLILIDVCHSSSEEVRNLIYDKRFSNRDKLAIGVRCNSCKTCQIIRDENTMSELTKYIFDDIAQIPTLPELLQDLVSPKKQDKNVK